MSTANETTEKMNPVEVLPYLHSVFGRRLLDYHARECAIYIGCDIMEIPSKEDERPRNE